MDVKVYGAPWCPDCRRAKGFLAEQRVPYEWIDIERDSEGRRLVQQISGGKQIIPTILFEDGSILVEPSNAELAAKLGIRTAPANPAYELVIVGSGPAGLTAALYAAREGIQTLVVERSGVGGQAGVTERLENFPGFPDGVGGSEFADRLRAQAERFGAEVLAAQNVTALTIENGYKCIRTESGTELTARAVLLAVGSTYRRLNVPGEEDFLGAGVHFCATCDGPFYRGRDVMVVGGGNSAGEESLFLTKFSPRVLLVTRGPDLSASAVVKQKVAESPAITVVPSSTITAFSGANSRLQSVTIQNLQSKEMTVATPAGVFVFIGQQPNTSFLRGVVSLDGNGFILADKGLETSIPGIFAAGDAREGSTKQAASAVGEGATAALSVREYLRTH